MLAPFLSLLFRKTALVCWELFPAVSLVFPTMSFVRKRTWYERLEREDQEGHC